MKIERFRGLHARPDTYVSVIVVVRWGIVILRPGVLTRRRLYPSTLIRPSLSGTTLLLTPSMFLTSGGYVPAVRTAKVPMSDRCQFHLVLVDSRPPALQVFLSRASRKGE